MTRAQVAAVVKGVKYRSWRITLDDSGDIVVRAPVHDAYSRRPRMLLVYGYVCSPQQYSTEQQLLQKIYDAISSILHHEASEWFKYKGKRPFDPHQ